MAERHKWKQFKVWPVIVIANESLQPALPIKRPPRKKAFKSVAAFTCSSEFGSFLHLWHSSAGEALFCCFFNILLLLVLPISFGLQIKTQKTSSIGHPWVATRPYMCSSILPQNSYGQTIFSSKSRNFVDSWTLQNPLFACFCYFFGKNLTVEKGVFTWGSPLLQLSDTNRGSCHCAQIICKYLDSVDFLFFFSTEELVCNYLDTDYFPLLLFV